MKSTKVRNRPGGPVMELSAETAKELLDAGLFVAESEQEAPAPKAPPRKRAPK